MQGKRPSQNFQPLINLRQHEQILNQTVENVGVVLYVFQEAQLGLKIRFFSRGKHNFQSVENGGDGRAHLMREHANEALLDLRHFAFDFGLFPMVAANKGLYPSGQLIQAIRFSQVFIHALFQSANDIFFICYGRQHDDGDLRLLANLFCGFQSVHDRHSHINNHQIWR